MKYTTGQLLKIPMGTQRRAVTAAKSQGNTTWYRFDITCIRPAYVWYSEAQLGKINGNESIGAVAPEGVRMYTRSQLEENLAYARERAKINKAWLLDMGYWQNELDKLPLPPASVASEPAAVDLQAAADEGYTQVERLEVELAQLKAEHSELKRRYNSAVALAGDNAERETRAIDMLCQEQRDNDRLQAERDALAAALAWYADSDNYELQKSFDVKPAIEWDNGKLARQALAAVGK